MNKYYSDFAAPPATNFNHVRTLGGEGFSPAPLTRANLMRFVQLRPQWWQVDARPTEL